MNLTYVYRKPDYYSGLENDTCAFYCQFMLAKNFSNSSFLSFLASKYLSHDNWDDRFLTNLYYWLVDEEFQLRPRKETEDEFALARKIRNRQLKVPNGGEALSACNHNRNALIGHLIEEIKFQTGDYIDEQWLTLFGIKEAKTGVFYMPEIHPSKVENEFAVMLKDKILSKDEIILFGNDLDFIDSTCFLDSSDEKNGIYQIFSMPLLKLFFSNTLAKQNMLFTRTNILSITDFLTDMIRELNVYLAEQKSTEERLECIEEFYEVLQPVTEEMQKKIDDQLYFQQAKNASDEHCTIEIRAGVCSTEILVDYFCNSEKEEYCLTETLKQEIFREKDPDSEVVFLYAYFTE